MESFIRDISVVVVCAAGLSWLALLTRQPIIIAYLLCGVIAGPWGLGLVQDVHFVDSLSRIGVTLLLFLAGIELRPKLLIELFRRTAVVTLCTCAAFCLLGSVFAFLWGFSSRDSLYIGLALMFSSTILVVKLLPTTALHQKHMGAFCISVLILQDLIAVGVLWYLRAAEFQTLPGIALLPLKGFFLIAFALIFERYVLRGLMISSERFHETLFLLCLGWCLGAALLSKFLGFSHEVGAFIAGVALARSPLALFLSEGLKNFRDFFLVLFFFVLGAKLDLLVAKEVLLPAVILGIVLVIIKPPIFNLVFRLVGEKRKFSREASVRLGQASEFSLIIAVLALETGTIGMMSSQFIQVTSIITMILSCYRVVFFYPTPLGFRKSLKQD
ncbi:MAG: cation:proton antiporter [PVC group bacterium]